MYIRVFHNGQLVREDRLNSSEIKSIFGPIWENEPKKTVRRRVKKAFGFGKKLTQRQGQLLYKGMPG